MLEWLVWNTAGIRVLLEFLRHEHPAQGPEVLEFCDKRSSILHNARQIPFSFPYVCEESRPAPPRLPRPAPRLVPTLLESVVQPLTFFIIR